MLPAMSRHSVRVVVAVAACLVAVSASAQTPLSQVEIRLERFAGGGCLHCDPNSLGTYQIKISGDGTVEYHNAEEPEDFVHVRIIAVDDVIALANSFIAAGF